MALWLDLDLIPLYSPITKKQQQQQIALSCEAMAMNYELWIESAKVRGLEAEKEWTGCFSFKSVVSCELWAARTLELVLILIRTQMTQKPMPQAEVGMRVRCANKACVEVSSACSKDLDIGYHPPYVAPYCLLVIPSDWRV